MVYNVPQQQPSRDGLYLRPFYGGFFSVLRMYIQMSFKLGITLHPSALLFLFRVFLFARAPIISVAPLLYNFHFRDFYFGQFGRVRICIQPCHLVVSPFDPVSAREEEKTNKQIN
jgi:hypothetical protein